MLFTNTYGETASLVIAAPTEQAHSLELIIGEGTFDETFDETFLVASTTIVFERGNGSRFLAIASKDPITDLPKDGVTYLLGHYFSDGSFVVGKGIAPSINLTSLTPGTWYVRVFEFNGAASVEKYNRDTAVDNPLEFEI